MEVIAMNHIFKKIWNKSLGCMVVVSENAKSAGKTDNTVGGFIDIEANSLEKTGKIQLYFPIKAIVMSLFLFSVPTAWAENTGVDGGDTGGSDAISGAFVSGLNNAALAQGASAIGNSIYKTGDPNLPTFSDFDVDTNTNTIIKIRKITVETTTDDWNALFADPTKLISINGSNTFTTDQKQAFLNAMRYGGNAAIGKNSNALGSVNIASGENSNAVGFANTASGVFTNAIGSINTASGLGSNTIGYANTGTSVGSTAIGLGNQSTGIFSNAVGGSVVNIPQMNVQLDANDNKKISIDGIDVITVNAITGTDPHQVAQDLTAADIDSINGQSLSLEEKQLFVDLLNNSNPPQFNTASGMLANALGSANIASGTQSSAVGVKNTASGYMSSAVGFNNQATAKNSSVFGSNSQATHEGAMALGNDSETDRINSISVGKVGAEKQITNVANATQAKDAVNLSQVQGLIANIPTGGTVASDNYAQGSTNAALGAGNGFQHELTRDANNKILTVNGIKVQTTGSGTNIADITGFEVLVDYFGTTILSMETDAAKVAAFQNAVQKGGNISVGENSSAIGIRNIAITTAKSANAIGYQNISKGSESNAIGNYNIASGTYSNAMGSASVAIGESSTALGNAVYPTGMGGFFTQNDANGYVNRINGISVQSTATSDYDLESNPSKLTQFNGEPVTAEQAADIIQALKRGANLTTADHTTAIGTNNIAAKYNSNAIGYGNTATGKASSAMGLGNKAQGWQSSAVGANNTAQADYSSAIGFGNTAQSMLSHAIGGNNLAAGQNSNAVGVNNQAKGVLSNAMGSGGYLNSDSFQRDPTAPTDLKRFLLGGSVVTTSTDITTFADLNANMILTVDGKTLSTEEQQYFYGLFDVMNSKNIASGIASNAFGMGNTASGTQSSAIGVQNTAAGYMSNAVGYNNHATAKNSSAFGNSNKVFGVGSTAVGSFTSALQQSSTVIGGSYDWGNHYILNNANGTQIAAVGYGGGAAGQEYATIPVTATGLTTDTITHINGVSVDQQQVKAFLDSLRNGGSVSSGNFGTAIGLSNIAAGVASSNAIGVLNVVTGSYSTAIGQENVISSDNSAIVGSNNKISGVKSTIVGSNNKISGINSTIIGANSTVTANYATAIGYNSLADEDNTVSVGRSGAEKRITNVANATKGTDAVNLNTLNLALQGSTGTGMSKNYAHDVSDTALGSFSGTAHRVQKDSTGKIITVDGITVTSTGGTIDDITGLTINGVPASAAQVATFKEAAKNGGNIAVGLSSSAVGVKNTASGKTSSAVGYANIATQEQSSAMGALNYVSGKGSSAIGSASTVDTNGRLISNNGPISSIINDMNEIVLKPYGLATNITEIAGISVVTTASSWADLENDPSKLTSVNGNTSLSLAEKEAFIKGLKQGANVVIGHASSAMGSQNTIFGKQSSAVGFGNTVLGESNSALGLRNFAEGETSNAIGSNNQTSNMSKDANAIGANNKANGWLSNAIGSKNTASAQSSSAIGVRNIAREESSVALGFKNQALGIESSALGTNNTAIGQGASAIGANTHKVNELLWDLGARVPDITTNGTVITKIDGVDVVSTASDWDSLKANPSKLTSINGVVLDAQSQTSIINSLKTGGNIALGKASNAVGSQNIAAAENSSVFGVGSIATAKNSTAIGYNAVADEEHTVSVGKVGAEQRITHVADAVKGTDAANKNYVDTALSTFTGSPDTVLYDANTNKATITLAGGATGTKITNLQNGTADSDAVNFGQLKVKADQSVVTALDGRVGSAESSITTLQGDVGTLRTDLTGTQTDVSNLQTGLTGTQTNVTALTGRVGTAETAITALDGRVGGAESGITTLQGDVGTLRTDLTGTQTDVSNLQTGLTGTQANVTALTGRMGTAETAITANTTAITALDGRVGGAESSITTLQGDVGTLRTDLTGTQTNVSNFSVHDKNR